MKDVGPDFGLPGTRWGSVGGHAPRWTGYWKAPALRFLICKLGTMWVPFPLVGGGVRWCCAEALTQHSLWYSVSPDLLVMVLVKNQQLAYIALDSSFGSLGFPVLRNSVAKMKSLLVIKIIDPGAWRVGGIQVDMQGAGRPPYQEVSGQKKRKENPWAKWGEAGGV